VEPKPVFLIGAGRTGQLVAREIIGRHDSNFDIIGFIDDDPYKLGKIILGVKVFGGVDDLAKLAQQYGVKDVILTVSSSENDVLQSIIEKCEDAQLNLRIVPSLFKLDNTLF
jgi:FlaA1/EpsC-like NDP-sugar epimerase